MRVVQACQPALYTQRNPLGQVKYEVVEPQDAGDCGVSMTYTDNPNPAWENKPLTFVLDPGKAIEPQLKQAVTSCMTGAGSWPKFTSPLKITYTNRGLDFEIFVLALHFEFFHYFWRNPARATTSAPSASANGRPPASVNSVCRQARSTPRAVR